MRRVNMHGAAATSKSLTVTQVKAMLDGITRDELDVVKEALASDTRLGVQSALMKAEQDVSAREAEEARIRGLYEAQERLAGAGRFTVGLDEVGRGPLAGPLTVAAVVLPSEPMIVGLNDSKQIKEAKRFDRSARD